MEKEGGYVNRPPLLDGDNYDYWKSRMVAFLKSVDSRTWKAVLKGWSHPMVTDKEGKSTLKLKAEEDWSKDEDELALGNSKALNALFNGVDTKMFKLIKHCVVAKDAWEILKTYNEGTKKVKMAKLQLLTTKFESLKMKEDENIHEYHMNIMDIANSSESLGEKMSEEKLVRKILRSLPARFDMKVTAIEEANDVSEMKVEELIGSLKTFEVAINDKSESRFKSIAFVSNAEDNETKDSDAGDNISESIALIGKQLNRVIQRIERKSGTNVGTNAKANQLNINKNTSTQKKIREEDQGYQGKVQCHECEGYGHIRSECPNYIKRRALAATWSDGDTDSEDEHVSAKYDKALTGVCGDEPSTEFSYEELLGFYKKACEENQELTKIMESQLNDMEYLRKENDSLYREISRLKDEKESLLADMEDLDIEVRVLKYKIESIKQDLSDERLGERFSLEKLTLDPHKKKGQKPQHLSQHPRSRVKTPYEEKICHYCKEKGHIKAVCSARQRDIQVSECSEGPKKEWKPKDETSLIAHTSLKVTSKDDWYFDSGCSKHMTGAGAILTKFTPQPTSYVTFGDGAKGEIKGKGKIVNKDLPNLDDVLLVNGLTANLISISQLCDLNLRVNFTKEGCVVTNDNKEVIMKGVRSKDNCYLWVPIDFKVLSTCLMSKEDDVQLWHQKLGHLHLRGIKKIISKEAIRGLPQLSIKEDTVCGECQIGKQVKTSHPKLQHLSSTRVLELLHMDLMGPMQVESIGGKRYALVVVDDFSRYTWIEFLKEKSKTFGIFRELCLQVQNEKSTTVVKIRSDHGKEFENRLFHELCASEGMKHEFSSPITPQQNGIAERKNRTIQEAARVMPHATPSVPQASFEFENKEPEEVHTDDEVVKVTPPTAT
ncbi:gag-protease polyprotein, partial [Trifolium medium]|nr:gag-protease polyprotein [Trifolium medium]